MTGQQVFDLAMQLGGYDTAAGTAAVSALRARAFAVVDAVYAELWTAERPGESAAPLRSLQDPLPLSDYTVRQVMPWGILMLLCLAEEAAGDGAGYAALYDRKRAGIPKAAFRRRDVLPRGWGG